MSHNASIASKNRQSCFVHSTPQGLNGAQHLAVNRDGTIMYGLRVRVEISIVEAPNEPPEVITTATDKTICKYHVYSGISKTFSLDDDFDPLLLAQVHEFYALCNNLVVMICYNAEHYQFIQIVILLEHSIDTAQLVAIRRKTVSRMTSPPIINLSFLDKGRILLCGARASVDGINERMSLSIAADPLNSLKLQDEDLSSLMEDFNKFLATRPLGSDGKSLISLFLLNMDDKEITILLSEIDPENPQNEPAFATSFIGLINRKDNSFSVENINNTDIDSGELLTVSSISKLKSKNGSVWMSFSVTDTEKLKTIYWRLKHLYVRVMLRLMIFGFHGSLYLWRFDNGLTFHCFTRILTLLHGPSMIPIYSPQKKFLMCHLNLDKRRFFRCHHPARILKNHGDPNETNFAISFDIDSAGGSVVLDHPTDHAQNSVMKVCYYPNPTKPQSLATLATYSAYRYFPAFEKYSLLRQMMGLIDWNWNV